VLDIGSASADSGTPLYKVASAARLSDGRIVVANGGTSEVFLFSPQGRLVGRAGGTGGGPREFRPNLGFGIKLARAHGDTVLAYSYGAGEVLVFAPTGAFARSIVLRANKSDERFDRASGAGWLQDGSLLATAESYAPAPESPPHGVIRPDVALLRFDSDGALVDTLGHFSGNERYTAYAREASTITLQSLAAPFGRGFRAVARDSMVAVGVTDAYEMRLYGPDGRLQRLVRGPYVPSPVDRAARESWLAARLEGVRDARMRRDVASTYESLQFPSTMPAFAELALDAAGRLWVEPYYAPGGAAEAALWRVYDSAGTFLGTVSLPHGLKPLDIGADYLLGLTRDSLDVEHVQLYPLNVRAKGPKNSP